MLRILGRPVAAPREVSGVGVSSNLLGTDRSVCNWGGPSFKRPRPTSVDERCRRMVKGSGSDLANATAKNFTALELDPVLPLLERTSCPTRNGALPDPLHLDPKHRACRLRRCCMRSCLIPMSTTTHPDSIISICCTPDGKQIATRSGRPLRLGALYQASFTLSKMMFEAVKSIPKGRDGADGEAWPVTWPDLGECYRLDQVIGEAEKYIAGKSIHLAMVSSAVRIPATGPVDASDIAAKVMPALRGAVTTQTPP